MTPPLTLSEFDFALPRELIAQRPAAERSAARLLDGRVDPPRDRHVRDLPDLLRAGDLLVVNDTAVIKARLFGAKASGGMVEALVERVEDDHVVVAQLRASKAPRAGTTDPLRRRVRRRGARPGRQRRFALSAALSRPTRSRCSSASATCRCRRTSTAPTRRSTASATRPCSPSVRARSPRRRRRCTSTPSCSPRSPRAASSARAVTLHVGAGTFQPVRSDRIAEHVMHSERFEVNAAAAAAIARARAARRPDRRRRHDQPARARSRGAASRAGRVARRSPRRDRSLHHAGLRVPRRRPAADQLPLAQEHAADARVGVRRPRADPRALRARDRQRYRFFSYGDAMLLARDAGTAA